MITVTGKLGGQLRSVMKTPGADDARGDELVLGTMRALADAGAELDHWLVGTTTADLADDDGFVAAAWAAFRWDANVHVRGLPGPDLEDGAVT